MEPTVKIVVRLEGDEETHVLDKIPMAFDELCSCIYKTTGAANFKVKYQEWLISSTRDLIVAYLENRTDTLEIIVDEDLSIGGYMGNSMENLMQPADAPKAGQFTVTNGTISKQDLLQIIDEMTEEARVRLVANNREFVQRRQEVYQVNEERWREVAFEQLAFQEKLLMTITGDVCRKHSINPEIFQQSCRTHAQHEEVARALEEMATKTLAAEGEIPEALTKEKLREVLLYTCDFLENYLRTHPPSHPADFILLKVREGDEVLKHFGFDENHMANALTKYEIDKLDEWADVRERLSNVMRNALGFDPSMMGMGF